MMSIIARFPLYLLMIVMLSGCLGEMINPSLAVNCSQFTFKADSVTYGPGLVGTATVYARAFDGLGNQILNQDVSGPVGLKITPADETFTFTTPPQANPIYADIFSPASSETVTFDTVFVSVVGNCPDLNQMPFAKDGRLNSWDAAAPFAVYQVDGGLHFYWIQPDSSGVRELIVTAEQIASVPQFPEQNTLIAANERVGVYLYRLTDGFLQAQATMRDGKQYVLIFASVYSADYESREIQYGE